MRLKLGINIIIFACQEINNELRFNIYCESLTIFIAFQTKETLEENVYIVHYIHIRKFWGGEERTKNSFNLICPDECLSP